MWERLDYYFKTNCVSSSGFRLTARDAYETARNIQYIFKPGFLKMFSTPKPIHIDELCKKYKELCPDMESSFPGHIDMIFDKKLITLLGFPVDRNGLVYWDLSITPEDFKKAIEENFNHSNNNEINQSDNTSDSNAKLSIEENEYIGEWKNAKYHGQGTFTTDSGNKYVGEWKDGRMEGQGTLTTDSGNKYVGEFKNGVREGHGTYIFASGDKYVGEFKNNEYEGQGTYNWADGTKYVGEYKDGVKEGLGIIIFGTGEWEGEKYVGEWKNDVREGQGTYTYTDGTTEAGIWKNGELVTPN